MNTSSTFFAADGDGYELNMGPRESPTGARSSSLSDPFSSNSDSAILSSVIGFSLVR